MTAEKHLNTIQGPPSRGDRELLTDDLKQERAVQIHRWKLCEPGVRIEIRLGVDQAREYAIRVAQLGARLLQGCGAAKTRISEVRGPMRVVATSRRPSEQGRCS
jgi:hypothetical protein